MRRHGTNCSDGQQVSTDQNVAAADLALRMHVSGLRNNS